MCPRTTACNHLPCSRTGSCMRRWSSAFTTFSFACSLLRIVCRNTVYIPLLLFFTQMCVKSDDLHFHICVRERVSLGRFYRYALNRLRLQTPDRSLRSAPCSPMAIRQTASEGQACPGSRWSMFRCSLGLPSRCLSRGASPV